MDTLREAIKEAIKIKQTNSRQVAKKIGFSPSYISEILNGQKRINETLEDKLCKELDIEKSYIIRKDDTNAETWKNYD